MITTCATSTAGTEMPNKHKIQKVLPLLLQLEKNKDDYFPEAVSLGPYHHGEPKLAFVEAFKPEAVKLFVEDGREKEEAYYDKVVSIIGDIRNCYEPGSTDNYSDADLAQMMLRDASLIIIYMEVSASDTQCPEKRTLEKVVTMMQHLGMLTFEILSRDLTLLQNQIPLRVIKLLIDLRYEAGEGTKLIDRFLYKGNFGVYRQEGECNLQKRKQPLHLLEAAHRVLVQKSKSGGAAAAAAASPTGVNEKGKDLETGVCPPLAANGLLIRLQNILSRKKAASEPKNNSIRKSIPKFRAATDLKAKGIYFRPSPSNSLNDVSFKSCLFNAWLEVPACGVSSRSKVFYKNMVAYELSPNSPAKGEISSYISFMNSLIEKTEDVKELREREILYNLLDSDDEVLNVFKDINTHGAGTGMFEQVRDQIHAHSNSRMKTWMAELIHTNFKSPWTASAFLAALALLAISVAQLYYAVHPPRN